MPETPQEIQMSQSFRNENNELKIKSPEAKALGSQEMQEILDHYNEAELGLLFSRLTNLQLNWGCSSQCDFCGVRAPKGPKKYFTAEAISYLMDKNITTPEYGGTVAIRRLLEQRARYRSDTLHISGFSDDILDNPDFLEILKIVPMDASSITTSYPTTSDDDLQKLTALAHFCDSRGIILRISVREENLRRLIDQGLLTTIEYDGEFFLQPPKNPKTDLENLTFAYRFANGKTKDGLRVRNFNNISGGLIPAGRNINGEGKNTGVVSESEIVLSPTGFRNYLMAKGDENSDYRHHKKSAGLDLVPAKIADNFSNLSELLNTLKTSSDVSVHTLLKYGVLNKKKSDHYTDPELPGYDRRKLKMFTLENFSPNGNSAEQIKIEVIYHLTPKIARVAQVSIFSQGIIIMRKKFPPPISTSAA